MLEKKWYVVFTKSRWEQKVVSLLEKASIEHYCPTTKVQRQWSDRKKTLIEPLFKSYVFVNVSERQKWDVKDIPGVVNYVYYLGRPAIIKPEEIELIRQFLSLHEYVGIRDSKMGPGDLVKINTGAFMDMEAEIVSIKGQRVLLNIPCLGIALIATHTGNTSVLKSE